MAFFKKILLNSPVHLASGKKIGWTALMGNEGVLTTEDTAFAEELRAAITKGIGGVSEIDEATFDDLKKNPAIKSKKPQWQPGVMPDQISPFLGSKASSIPSVAAAEPVASPESTEEKPAGRRASVRKNVHKATDE